MMKISIYDEKRDIQEENSQDMRKKRDKQEEKSQDMGTKR